MEGGWKQTYYPVPKRGVLSIAMREGQWPSLCHIRQFEIWHRDHPIYSETQFQVASPLFMGKSYYYYKAIDKSLWTTATVAFKMAALEDIIKANCARGPLKDSYGRELAKYTRLAFGPSEEDQE